jgi:hypothetical protein
MPAVQGFKKNVDECDGYGMPGKEKNGSKKERERYKF